MKIFKLIFIPFIVITINSYTQTNTKNFVISKSIKVDSIFSESQIASLNLENKSEIISYFDGLGRISQTIEKYGSPSGCDVVTPVIYDEFGRKEFSYLPFTMVNNNGNYIENPIYFAEMFHGTEYCYKETKFDHSPMNLIKEEVPEGNASRNNNISIKINTFANTELNLIKWSVEDDNCLRDGDYIQNSLSVTETEDENGHYNRVYKNGMGQTIITASFLNEYWLKTYFVYDDYGLLRFVIPPKATKMIEDGSSFSNVRDNLCYIYKYDGKKRMIYKKLPGAEATYIIYDDRNLPIMTQNGNMRNTGGYNKWMYTKYDKYKRPIISGFFTDESNFSPESMQGFITQTQSDSLWEEYDEVNHLYTNYSFPDGIYTSNCQIISETYYDTYDYLQGNAAYNYTDFYGIEVSDKTKGMVTISKTYIFDTQNNIIPEYLLTVNYYDEYGRTIETISDNHLQGVDKIWNKYNFSNNLTDSRHTHNIAGQPSKTIDRHMLYDFTGRLIKTEEKFDNTDWQITKTMGYNENNHLQKKRFHVVQSGGVYDCKQEVNYSYNIRGWLTKINNPETMITDYDLFAMELKYDNGTFPQYNGNISELTWKSNKYQQLKTYRYSYDEINRLISADFIDTKKNYDVNYSYDLNGNILTLNRAGKLPDGSYGFVDQIEYFYTGNQLRKTDDNIIDDTQLNLFSDNGARIPDDREFFYDYNGNMYTDLNKRINGIQYNFMNLPIDIPVSTSTTEHIYFIYDAAGIKLRKEVPGSTTDYIGDFVYRNGVLKYIMTDYGRIQYNSGNIKRYYNITDHLGNVRVTFNDAGIVVQEDSYYPFGLTMNGFSFVSQDETYLENNYLYNGKELQEDFDLDWYDYGARMYDAQLGRFHTIDQKSEMFSFQSPYIYAGNDPIKNIDVNGEFSFSSDQLNYIKTNYPKAYAYIMQSDYSKPGMLQWAHNDHVTNAMISNSPYHVYNSPNSPDYGISWETSNKQILSKDVIIKAFTPDNLPLIYVTATPGGTDMAGGYNLYDDGSNYSTPLEINENLFIALENASTPSEAQIALENLVSTVIHEYLEDFGDDILYDAEGNVIGGINKAQAEIFGGVIPRYNGGDNSSSEWYINKLLLQGIFDSKGNIIIKPEFPTNN